MPNTILISRGILYCIPYVHVHLITRYGSTLYIGIAMVFVFSPYIRKFSSYFHFQVIVTFNDFIALNVWKLNCIQNISVKKHQM